MFPEIPKLFGREFVVGYFLPALIFIVLEIFILVYMAGESRPWIQRPNSASVLVVPKNGYLVSTRDEDLSANCKLLRDSKSSKVSCGLIEEASGEAGGIFDVGDEVVYLKEKTIPIDVTKSIVKNAGVVAQSSTRTVLEQVIQYFTGKSLVVTLVLGWLLALILSATNKNIYQFLEGYGRLNPLKIFRQLERYRHGRYLSKIRRLDDRFEELTDVERKRLADYSREFAHRFPSDGNYLLSTPFGNAIRAFEDYPRQVYGVDSIPAWDRLSLIVPESSKKLVDATKSIVDFWMNLFILDFVIIITLVSGVFVFHLDLKFELLVALLLMVPLFFGALSSTMAWGNMVKATFDVYLNELWGRLEFEDADDRATERATWESFSNIMVFRDMDGLPARKVKPPG